MWMFFDPVYLLVLIVAGVLSGAAALYTKSAYARAKQVPIARRMSGADVARAILDAKDIHDVQVVEHQGFLSDHYNPMTKTLALSPEVYRGQHAAAAGIAAHEVGHAIQHAFGYLPLQLRSMLVPVANIGSNLGLWLVTIGIVLASMQGATAAEAGGFIKGLAVTGVVLFGAAALFTLVTLPVEFDASARAKTILTEMGFTTYGEEEQAVRSMLRAAGLTYVAAAVGALLQLLYWAWRAGLLSGGRRE